MKKLLVLITSIILLITLVGCNNSQNVLTKNIINTSPQYTLESDGHIEKIITELCSDNYRGRVVGTIENVRASEYIVNFFEELSIPAFKDSNYYSSTNLRLNGDVSSNTNNISAVIKGSKSDKAVFITAHLDHIKNSKGNSLPGAIDNASGISVMLEIAHKLSYATQNTPLAMDIVFVAFNAEETGLNGSYEFMRNNSVEYKELYNINIDCVGYKEAYNLVMGNSHPESQKLYEIMKQTFDDEGIQYNDEIYATKDGIQMGTSDHEIFRRLGYPALVIGDEKILDVVHTYKDNLDNIDFSDLEKISDCLSKFILKYDDEMFR